MGTDLITCTQILTELVMCIQAILCRHLAGHSIAWIYITSFGTALKLQCATKSYNLLSFVASLFLIILLFVLHIVRFTHFMMF